METSVSIPEEIFRQAEELAAELGISRDELYAKALTEFLSKEQSSDVTEALNQVYCENNSSLDSVTEKLQAVSLPAEQW
jgi:metal-responsive CopG/Arc/MetJ family transcriptional regulator